MRISKLPEERKQEIMDIAMRVFSEKGFEQTTMRDIAAAVGVVPGLCYRYFSSKQELFNTALQNYATECCKPFICLLANKNIQLDELMNDKNLLFIVDEGSGNYQTFFHQKENENFHILLCDRICSIMLPYVTTFISDYAESQHIKITNSKAFAAFYLYGATAILNDDTMSEEEKTLQLKEIVNRLISNK